MDGNPIVSKTQNYRKQVIHHLKHLRYLDQMPVTEEDRILVEAWFRGGRAEEKKERMRLEQEKRERERQNFEGNWGYFLLLIYHCSV